MSDFGGGIPPEARRELARLSGGPLKIVVLAFALVIAVNFIDDMHVWLQAQLPGAPDYLLRVVVCFAFTVGLLCVLVIAVGLMNLGKWVLRSVWLAWCRWRGRAG